MRRRERWFVRIDHLTDRQLENFGYYCVEEDAEFKLYQDGYAGSTQVVLKENPYLLVDDINDARQMGIDMVSAPGEDDTKH